MSMIIRRPVPNLVIAKRVVDKMASAAGKFIADETGEAMIGLVMPDTQTDGVATIYVLDTISPDDSGADEDAPVREWGMFEQGDDLQHDIFNWLQDNWEGYREKRRGSFGSAVQAKWDAPLRHVGDWHKQPGYMIKPSFGDLVTALHMLDDEENGLDFLLAPIVTLGHPSTTDDDDASVNFLNVRVGEGEDADMRVDFWYIHRDVRRFQPIIPKVVADDQLPGLPPIAWYLADDARLSLEVGQLEHDGLFVTLIPWRVDDELPLKVCFMMARQGGDKMLLIATSYDHPKTAPYARVAPFTALGADEDMASLFERLWPQSTPVKNPPGFKWTEEMYLIEYVQAIEESLGIAPSDDDPPASDEKPVPEVKSDPTPTGETAEVERK